LASHVAFSDLHEEKEMEIKITNTERMTEMALFMIIIPEDVVYVNTANLTIIKDSFHIFCIFVVMVADLL
jgi:hypothetical protein